MKYKEGICYSCCETKRLTEEHIIPQALGGKLSALIYCKGCNDQFGKEIDAELIKNIGFFGTALNIKRIRGNNQPYEVTSVKNGTKLAFNGKDFRRKKPIVKIERDGETIKSVDVRARTKSELHQICSNIKKKFKLSEDANYSEEKHPGPTYTAMDFVYDNSLIRRCVSKVAYSLLCIKLPSDIVMSDSFDEVRNYIRFGSTGHLATANYVHTSFMTDNIRPLHKIHICMNRRKNLVIGFICFFGTFRYTALLSKTFKSFLDWPGLDHTLDPVTSKYITGKPNFRAPDLDVNEVLSPKHSKKMVLGEIERGHKIIENYVKDHKFLKVETEE